MAKKGKNIQEETKIETPVPAPATEDNFDAMLDDMFGNGGEIPTAENQQKPTTEAIEELNITPEGMEDEIEEVPEPTEPTPTEPAVEEKPAEPVVEEQPKPVEPIQPKNILEELEAELRAMSQKNEEQTQVAQEAKETIVEAQNDNSITPEEYNSLVDEYNKIMAEKEMLATDFSRLQTMIDKYKGELTTRGDRINEFEFESTINKPITQVINSDPNLKTFTLLLNKANATGKKEFETQAIDNIYTWLEGKTGVSIKELIKQEIEAKNNALQGDETSGSYGVSRQANKQKDETGDLVDDVLSSTF